jgi:hypothetical protein
MWSKEWTEMYKEITYLPLMQMNTCLMEEGLGEFAGESCIVGGTS